MHNPDSSGSYHAKTLFIFAFPLRKQALDYRFNMDQSVQYTGQSCIGELKKNGIRSSMGGNGRWMEKETADLTFWHGDALKAT